MKHRNKSIAWFGAGFICEGFLDFWFGKTTINSFWMKARFLFEVLWSSTRSYAPFSLLHSNKGVMDWELWAAVQLFPHKSFIWMKGDWGCSNHSREWHQKHSRQMDVTVTAVKGPYEKIGIKTHLFHFSSIALFYSWMDGGLSDPMAA